MNKILIYSTPTCPFCVKVKEYLKEKNQVFEDFDVSINQDKAKEMIEKSGQMGVPVVIINDKDVIVGFDKEKIDKILNL